MRVPIYPEDLLPQTAFKRLAKSIQKRWPGTSPIGLSLARETLSKGLGYANYHDLRKASIVCRKDGRTPPESLVRAQIAAAISSVLVLANDNSVPSSVLGLFVETLPLKALSAFKGSSSRSPQEDSSGQSTPGFTEGINCPVNETCPASPVPPYRSPFIRMRRPKLQTMPSSSEVFAHIEAIKQGIENSRNLRDQSLFALLKTGLQSQVILGARVSQVVSLDAYMASSAGTIIDVIKAKSSLPLESAAVIERYISAAKLSADDYLFPSADRTQPMSTAQLSRIFRSWEKQAGFPLSKLTPHSLRKASNVSRSTLGHGYEQIADQLGHSSAAMVEKYVQLAATGADAILKAKKRT